MLVYNINNMLPLHAHIKGHTRWSMNLTVVLTISLSSSSSLLSTNMRIPNTAEFLALFVSTGQFTSYSNQRKIDIMPFMITDTHRFPFHIAGADSAQLGELAVPVGPPCDRPLYTVQSGDTCNSIADAFDAPTLVIF